MKKVLLISAICIVPFYSIAERKVDFRDKNGNNKHRHEWTPPVDCSYDDGVLSVKILAESDCIELKAKDASTGEVYTNQIVYGNSEITLPKDNVIVLEIRVDDSEYEGYIFPEQ